MMMTEPPIGESKGQRTCGFEDLQASHSNKDLAWEAFLLIGDEEESDDGDKNNNKPEFVKDFLLEKTFFFLTQRCFQTSLCEEKTALERALGWIKTMKYMNLNSNRVF